MGQIPLPDIPESANVRALASKTRDIVKSSTATTVTLSELPTSAPELVFKNGLLLDTTAYSINGPALTLTTPLITTDVLHVHYQFRPAQR